MEASPRPLEGPPSCLSWVPAAQHQQCSLSLATRMETPPSFRLNYEPFSKEPASHHPLVPGPKGESTESRQMEGAPEECQSWGAWAGIRGRGEKQHTVSSMSPVVSRGQGLTRF